MKKVEILTRNLKDVKDIFDKGEVRFWLDSGTLLAAVRDGEIFEWEHDVDLGTFEDNSWNKITSVLPELQRRGFTANFTEYKIYKDVFQKNVWLTRWGYTVGVNMYQKKCEKALRWITKSGNLLSDGLKTIYYLLLSQRPDTRSNWNYIMEIIRTCLSFLPSRSRKALSDLMWRLWKRTGARFWIFVAPRHYFEDLDEIEFYEMTFNIPSEVESYLEYRYGGSWETPTTDWSFLTDDGAIKAPWKDKDH